MNITPRETLSQVRLVDTLGTTTRYLTQDHDYKLYLTFLYKFHAFLTILNKFHVHCILKVPLFLLNFLP